MNDRLKDGDHVVFSCLDRGFRNIADMANTLADWTARGVVCHFAEEGISTDDPGGRMLANIVVVFAQMEAEIASDRAKEARAQLAAKGRFTGGFLPPFWKVYKTKRTKVLVPNRKKIAQFRLLLLYTSRLGLPVEAALEKLEALHAKREGRKPISIHGVMSLRPFIHNWTRKKPVPPTIEKDELGRYFPMWTRRKYRIAATQYDGAIQALRNIAAKARELREMSNVERVQPKKPGRRQWTEDTETAFTGMWRSHKDLLLHLENARAIAKEQRRREDAELWEGDGI